MRSDRERLEDILEICRLLGEHVAGRMADEWIASERAKAEETAGSRPRRRATMQTS